MHGSRTFYQRGFNFVNFVFFLFSLRRGGRLSIKIPKKIKEIYIFEFIENATRNSAREHPFHLRRLSFKINFV